MKDHRRRAQALERRLRDASVSGAVLAPGPNLYYISGYAGEADRFQLLVISDRGSRTFISPEAYVEQVRDESWIDDVIPVTENSPRAVAKRFASLWDERGPLLMDDQMRLETAHRIQKSIDSSVRGLTSEHLAPLRTIKDDGEVEALRKAASVADRVSEEVRQSEFELAGMTERELATHIRARLHAHGCEDISFPVSVGSGPNGALPTQHRQSDRTIQSDDVVVLDFGGILDHYASDQSRVIVVSGSATDRFREAYHAVRTALETGIDRIQPGMIAGEADTIVRTVIEEAGYGEQFTTGTGHGVGLRAHESPSISPNAETEIKPGMVFSIEPGIYLKGGFGVRLENLVVVTEDGVESLNSSSLDWRPLD